MEIISCIVFGICLVIGIWVITKVITAGILETIQYYKKKYKEGKRDE